MNSNPGRALTTLDLARVINGVVCGKSVRIGGCLAAPESAQEQDVVVFFNDSAPSDTKACTLVVGKYADWPQGKNIIVVDEPRIAFAQLTAIFRTTESPKIGISQSAVCAHDFDLEKDVFIGPHCTIENDVKIGSGSRVVANAYIGTGSRIGNNCTLDPNVVLHSNTVLGENVHIHANTTVGCDGFGYVSEHPERPKMHSLGRVVIGNNVEIGANSVIQKGTLGDTIVGDGTKFGDQAGIGHNAVIGQSCLIVGQVGIGGSCRIGDNVRIGIGCKVKDHVHVADGTVIMLSSNVIRDTEPNSILLGNPAQDHLEEKVRYRNLTQLSRATNGEIPHEIKSQL